MKRLLALLCLLLAGCSPSPTVTKQPTDFAVSYSRVTLGDGITGLTAATVTYNGYQVDCMLFSSREAITCDWEHKRAVTVERDHAEK